MLVLTACSAGLQPVVAPVEMTPEPSQASEWQELEAVRQGDWFHLLNAGGEALDWRLRAIDSAVSSIDMQTFIWDLDSSGAAIKEHLLAAARRGVVVKVLVDDSLVLDADQELLDIDQHASIALKVFNPFKRRSNQAVLREVLNLGEFHRLDHRMHNKVMVIDNRVAVLGGRNLADHYFGFSESDNFRDMEIVVGGPVVQQLADGFDRYWNNGWSFPVAVAIEQRAAMDSAPAPPLADLAPPGAHQEQHPQDRIAAWLELVQGAHAGSARLLLDSPPADDLTAPEQAPTELGEQLILEIDAATREVWLISAYLIPTPELEHAIQRARERGVRVRILTNSINSNNHLLAHSAYRNHARSLVEMGAEVHEVRFDALDRDLYIESPVAEKSLSLHAKMIVFDNDRVFVGSANLDPRSLHINTEMGLIIHSATFNAEVREAFEPDFSLRNAWRLELNSEQQMTWVSDSETLSRQPAHSFMRRIEDWFLSLLPIEGEM
ncbi:phospholipase D family protein [Halieaceae bacterium IMCC14734]|uniref:Phospholipase D family protein n=1 Tax=Candidatus Litorirhabdus singularis TaxID=2518993 RepID=A0ABT3TE78_9GAMM|nr:phospholipase D family protein [Candidatus Litorirhabdus singularis]